MSPAPRPAHVGALRFERAAADDEPELRRLARAQALPGWITIEFGREPNFFRAVAVEGDRHQVLVARESGRRRIVAMHTRSVRRVFIDGQVRLLGYLGQLRTDADLPRGRWLYRLLREGFAAGRGALRCDDELPYDLTAILSDNRPARRMLEAGLPGLPRYEPVAELVTLAFACRAAGATATGARSACEADRPAIASLLDRTYRRFQLAPAWSEADLCSRERCRGLQDDDFLIAERAGEPVGCVALWDQRAFKQMTVRAYRAPVAAVRPLYNLVAPALRRPRLPLPAAVLAQAWLSHLAVLDDDPDVAAALVKAALAMAARRGIEQALLGLTREHFALHALTRAFAPLRYRSQLYLVHWPCDALRLPALRGRPVHVEAATL